MVDLIKVEKMKINLTDEIWRILEKNRHYFVQNKFSRLKIIRQKIPGPGQIWWSPAPAPVKNWPPVDPWLLAHVLLVYAVDPWQRL